MAYRSAIDNPRVIHVPNRLINLLIILEVVDICKLFQKTSVASGALYTSN